MKKNNEIFTPNLNLQTYTKDTVISYLGQENDNLRKIDTAYGGFDTNIKQALQNSSTALETASNLNESISANYNKIQSNQNNISVNTANININKTNIDNNFNNIKKIIKYDNFSGVTSDYVGVYARLPLEIILNKELSLLSINFVCDVTGKIEIPKYDANNIKYLVKFNQSLMPQGLKDFLHGGYECQWRDILLYNQQKVLIDSVDWWIDSKGISLLCGGDVDTYFRIALSKCFFFKDVIPNSH